MSSLRLLGQNLLPDQNTNDGSPTGEQDGVFSLNLVDNYWKHQERWVSLICLLDQVDLPQPSDYLC